MGRDVSGIRTSKKPSNATSKSNGAIDGKVYVAPRIAVESAEMKDNETHNGNANGTNVEECIEKQELLSNIHGTSENLKSEGLRLSDKMSNSPVKPSPAVSTDQLQIDSPISQPPAVVSEKQVPFVNYASESGTIGTGTNYSSKTNDLHSPNTVKKSQKSSPLWSRSPLQFGHLKYHDEDDNLSVASSMYSAATSVRTVKSRITVPVAPTFRSADRASRRKEFYTKLEEKHKALETEKLEHQARTKEEEEAALKQLRKSMVYRANPVPNFYREGPPPKVELKKLPVTRAKSPQFTRRKSCGDAVKSSPDEKPVCTRVNRYSLGALKASSTNPTTPPSKDRFGRKSAANLTKKPIKDKTFSPNTSDQTKPLKDSTESSPVANHTNPTESPRTSENGTPVKETTETPHIATELQMTADIAVQT